MSLGNKLLCSLVERQRILLYLMSDGSRLDRLARMKQLKKLMGVVFIPKDNTHQLIQLFHELITADFINHKDLIHHVRNLTKCLLMLH